MRAREWCDSFGTPREMKQLLKAISTDYADAVVCLNRAPRRRPWSCQMHCSIAADNQFSGRPPAVWAHPRLHSEWLHTGNRLPRQALSFPHDDFLKAISAAWLQVSSWPTWTERSDVVLWHKGEVRRVTPERPFNLQEQSPGSKLSLNFRYLGHCGRAQRRSRTAEVDPLHASRYHTAWNGTGQSKVFSHQRRPCARWIDSYCRNDHAAI